MNVPLLDLRAQYQTIKDQVLEVTEAIYESQYFILGPHVDDLEKKIAEYCRVGHAVGVSSGTDALLLSLMAAGIGPGDRVLTTPYTFFATAGAVWRVGATPVFVDIDETTYNLSPDRLQEAVAAMDETTRQTVKAIVPVHLYGQCADMDPILKLAAEHGWVVIEDAAQAIGAEYRGRRAGSLGDYGCFSFFPSKNLGAFGDGGIVTARDQAVYEHLKILRVHGGHPKYYHHYVGGNFRLDALQAAIVAIKLAYLDGWSTARKANAARYRELFAAAGLTDRIHLPVEKESRHIYNQFVIRVDKRRDALKDHLTAQSIGSEVYYPVPLHLQACFAPLGYAAGDFPVAEAAARSTLALPIYPELTEAQQAYVVDTIAAFVNA
ncbi:glutamine--scyllo-inositol aminotransferase [Desulfosarcina ovata subsp. sediminis]|uniref:Glutamine--scyllo-inositol aminotransferase n=1 Tax=Desulfosarcina ovata subsp. sediminis TaxID=885957 RepID=A0A5K7ZM82_9BACT|nr:DegT/DnrJ/EryC1/StrS family aminotransferase [Desulfosarcina ovata]BBO79560.1 glutamine--scyllo-inositol aminotransferase [Desulfosarcina ovata subsp. sediminis]